MSPSLLSLILGLSLPGVGLADEQPVGTRRYLEMSELARCVRRGTDENPVLVKAATGITHELRLAIAIFANDVDADRSEDGMFEFQGLTLTGQRAYWGAMTDTCVQDMNAQGKVIDCKHERGIGHLFKETRGGETRYIATHFAESAQDVVKIEFAEEDCSFWPHGEPSQNDRVVLQSISFRRWCAESGPILFTIQNNGSPANPLKIEYGNARSRCILALLSSPTNYEFWMDARNQFMDREAIDPGVFKDRQLFDIDADGDLDLIQVERDPGNEQHPGGAWNLVLYKNREGR